MDGAGPADRGRRDRRGVAAVRELVLLLVILLFVLLAAVATWLTS